MANIEIPTVDLSHFLSNSQGDEIIDARKRAIGIMSKACSDYGFFYVINHGVSQKHLNRALQLSKIFFEYPQEEKLKCKPKPEAPFPAGYSQAKTSVENNAYFLMFHPRCGFNVFPTNPPELKETQEEMFSQFSKLSELIAEIINDDCLGLPHNLLKEYIDDSSWNLLLTNYYPSVSDAQNVGMLQHKDCNCLSLVVQDDAGGLEYLINGEWIPIIPPKSGEILVNVGDILQVFTNDKYKSTLHRVVSPEGRSRNSFVYSYNVHGDKWIEPLPQFTTEIQELPKYRRFTYKEYLSLRLSNKQNPSQTPEDAVTIAYYEI
ncbi:OLC1v1021995C1 [Oldenlandia corymbosa var. corymbosa]|uniref:OLC1v1021995C1 n=1 Tax=Oldenlandia corymbosa var. corymbosa TaxID=529605 RepID=A0AAV1BWW8_OLDCO|nr:OLC1v1021995C1 [Oldenlandia corymbosa var. corymbosa]